MQDRTGTLEAAPSRRASGRPPVRSVEATCKLLVEAAIVEFTESGYAKTSVGAVARRAGVSTRTLYKFVANKAELFRMAAEQRIDANIAALGDPSDGQSQSVDALFRLVRAYAQLVLSAESCTTTRMIIAERDQFPEVGNSYRKSVARVSAAFDDKVVALCDGGVLVCPAPAAAAELLRSMVNGGQRQMLLGQRGVATEREMQDWADRCTHLFLFGLRGE